MKILKAVALCSLTLIMSACGSSKAGESAASKEGMTLAQDLIMAVEQYQIETGKYPQSLGILVPDHIEVLPEEHMAELQMTYRPWQKQTSYRFKFFPDDNQRCDYSPEERWVCTGE